MSQEFPEAEIRAMDAKWYRLARYDSAIVSMNDGTSAAFYQRDPEKFRDLLKKTIEIHERLRREWPRLAAEYRAQLARGDLAGGLGGDVPALDSDPAAMTDDPTSRRVEELPLESTGTAQQGLLEVFRRRYLLRLLVRREISARYSGSFLGLLWSYINPLTQFFIYYFVIGVLIGLHQDVPNFAIHMFCGIIVVHYFTETFNAGTRSIVRNKALVRKMAMPTRDVPGRLDAGLALPRRARSW